MNSSLCISDVRHSLSQKGNLFCHLMAHLEHPKSLFSENISIQMVQKADIKFYSHLSHVMRSLSSQNLNDLRFSQQWLWTVLSPGIQCRAVCWKSTDISEEQAELATCFMLVFCLAYSSTLKTETTCSSETSVHFQRTTRRYVSEGITLLVLYLFNRQLWHVLI
jgi:hypothetical protein